jgi:hypothetical protein
MLAIVPPISNPARAIIDKGTVPALSYSACTASTMKEQRQGASDASMLTPPAHSQFHRLSEVVWRPFATRLDGLEIRWTKMASVKERTIGCCVLGPVLAQG